MPQHPLLPRVESTLAAAGLLHPPGQAIVVAVSGGPDSLALLHLLHELAQQHALRLHAAHLDHGLRGGEGEDDARFVAEVCNRLGVPLSLQRADVPALRAELKLSLEAAAREARYTFLAQVAHQTGASAVATGHTADDQAETVLLHLLRGAGLRGLRGMLPLSRWRSRDGRQQVALVRPLLEVARQETEAYCAGLGLAPRRDSSNAEERFARNRLRRTVMPMLRKLNPEVGESLRRLADSAARDLVYLESGVAGAWPRIASPASSGLRLQRDAFLALHPSLQAHLLQRAYAELAGEAADLTFGQVEAMVRLAAGGAGRAVSLGHGLRFITSYGWLFLSRGPLAPTGPALKAVAVPMSGEVSIPGWRIGCRLLGPGELPPRASWGRDPCQAHLDAQALGEALAVRARLPGDRFHPLGMPGVKKLKEFMIDARIPQHERDGTPLLVSEKGIAWVVGCRIAHWARVTPETRQALEVTFARE